MKIVGTAIFADKEGRILIGQRPEGKDLAGLWEFPGGKQEAGETVEQCIVRDVDVESLSARRIQIDVLSGGIGRNGRTSTAGASGVALGASGRAGAVCFSAGRCGNYKFSVRHSGELTAGF